MLVPVNHRKSINRRIEKLDRPIAGDCNQVVLIDLRPCDVVERVLRIVTAEFRVSRCR